MFSSCKDSQRLLPNTTTFSPDSKLLPHTCAPKRVHFIDHFKLAPHLPWILIKNGPKVVIPFPTLKKKQLSTDQIRSEVPHKEKLPLSIHKRAFSNLIFAWVDYFLDRPKKRRSRTAFSPTHTPMGIFQSFEFFRHSLDSPFRLQCGYLDSSSHISSDKLFHQFAPSSTLWQEQINDFSDIWLNIISTFACSLIHFIN